MAKTSDKLVEGETYDSLTLTVSSPLNRQYVKACDGSLERYAQRVHPGLIFAFSSVTQSPSFALEHNVAAVGAKFEATFETPARIGDRLTFDWRVERVYERRSRTYQISSVRVTNLAGERIMERVVNNTFIGGEHLERRVRWEKETGHRSAVSFAEFPAAGYEIVGPRKELTMEKQRYFSGGISGPQWPTRNIHTDREISIRAGIGKPIASGLMFEAYLAELLESFVGEKWLTGGEMKVVAIGMAGEGDTLVPKALVTGHTSERDQPRTRLELWCENQYANKVMIGSAEVARD